LLSRIRRIDAFKRAADRGDCRCFSDTRSRRGRLTRRGAPPVVCPDLIWALGGGRMYSHVSNFTFQGATRTERLRFASELLEIPAKIGEPETDIYWFEPGIEDEGRFY
jgi:hypothetical protein